MGITVTAINGMGSGEDSSGGSLQNLVGMDDSDHMYFTSDFLAGAGVMSVADTDLEVTENTPNNNQVEVAPGTCYVLNDSYAKNAGLLKFWRVELDAAVDVTIDANVSGNPRIDIICVKVDTGVSPDGTASNVATIVAIAGTPAGSPSVPSTPADHLKLAEVAVADGFVSIIDANITDRRTSVGIQTEKVKIIDDIVYIKDSGGDFRIAMEVDADDNLIVGDQAFNENAIRTMAKARAWASAPTALGSALGKVLLASESYDVGGDFAASAFTAPVDGFYQVTTTLSVTNVDAGDQVIVAMYVNSVQKATTKSYAPTNNDDPSASITDVLEVTAGHDIEMYGAVTGGTESSTTGEHATFMTVNLLNMGS